MAIREWKRRPNPDGCAARKPYSEELMEQCARLYTQAQAVELLAQHLRTEAQKLGAESDKLRRIEGHWTA